MADNSSKGGKNRTASLIIILLLLLLCAGSFYGYMLTMKMMDENESTLHADVPLPDMKSIEEAKELEKTADEYASMGTATTLAMQTALLAEISGRFPVGEASELVVIAEAAEASERAALGEEEPVVIEPDPPQVTVLAIMIAGQDRIAMVDIFGEDTGLVVRQGTKFSEGDARITKIDEKGVTFTWMGKSYTVAM